MRELLSDGTYLRYWLAVVVSFLGDIMTRITLVYVVGTLTKDPLLISLVVIAQLVSSGALGTFVGPLVDRLPPRVLLVGADLVRIPIVLAMIPFLRSVWALLTLVLLEGVGKAVFETARISAIPRIVGDPSRIASAVALFQSTNHTLNLLGPAFGGLLIVAGSVPAVLAIDAATFAVSAVLLGSMTVLRAAPAGGGEPYWRSLHTGVAGALRVPTLRVLGLILVPVMLVYGLFTTNFNAQLLTVFDLPALYYGMAHAVLGAGAIAGALLGPVLMRRYLTSYALLLASVALFGATLLALAPTSLLTGAAHTGMAVFAVIAVWCLAVGVGSSLFQVPVANTILNDLPESLRGRGVGLLNSMMIAFTVVGLGIGGLTARVFGVPGTIIVSGLVLLAVAAGFALPFQRAATSVTAGESGGAR